MSRFTDIREIVAKPKDAAGFKGHRGAIDMTIAHIFSKNDFAHRRYRNRIARLKKLEELKAPAAILESESRRADEALAVMKAYEELMAFMLSADMLEEKGLLTGISILEDAIEVIRHPKCLHCINCIMEGPATWKCNCSGCLIDDPWSSGPKDEEFLHEPGLCDFIPDDLSATEYLDFLCKNTEWGNRFVDDSELDEEDIGPDGKHKPYVNLEPAISCHHMAVLGLKDRYKDEIQQMEAWFGNASEGDEA